MEASSTQVTVRNNMDVAQSISYQGQLVTLGAYAEQTMPDDMAQLFITRCYPVVVRVNEEVSDGFIKKEEDVWVANMTGNPDFPKKITVRRRPGKGQPLVDVEIDNPRRSPRVMSREYDYGSWVAMDRRNEPMWYNYPKFTVSIPPGTRKKLPKSVAQWWMKRDSQMEPEVRGSCINSRPPTDFEPDTTWPLKDIQAYLRFVDPDAELGPSEDKLAAKLKKEGLSAAEAASKLRAVKNEVLARLKYRILDPRYRLPSRLEFQEYLTGKSADQLEQEQVEALLKKVNAESDQISA